MALSTAVLTVTDTWSDGKRQHVIGTIAVSPTPGTYAAGGLALALTDSLIKSTQLRFSIVRGLSAEFRYVYLPATGKLKIYDEDQTTGVQAELATAAVPAGVSDDTISFYGIFDQLR